MKITYEVSENIGQLKISNLTRVLGRGFVSTVKLQAVRDR